LVLDIDHHRVRFERVRIVVAIGNSLRVFALGNSLRVFALGNSLRVFALGNSLRVFALHSSFSFRIARPRSLLPAVEP
jgi:hypothetical protein